MTWRAKRQFFYLFGLVFLALIVLVASIVPKITKEPTCTDGKRNGEELGVDCGGSCMLYCKEQYTPLVIKWSRIFPAGGGLYNVVVFGENRNFDAFVPTLQYEVKVYDASNILLASLPGETHVMPNGEFAIFVPNINLAGKTPQRVAFTEADGTLWYQFRLDREDLPLVRDVNTTLEDWDSAPRLNTTLINESYVDSLAMDVVVILFDEDDNAIQVSKTFVESLKGQTSKKLFFSWREPLSEEPTYIKVIELPNYYSQYESSI